MASPPPNPTNRFDPAGWYALYDTPQRFPAGYVSRRSVEVVERLCADVGRPGQHWVDVGCGSAPLAAALSRQGLRVFGVDHDLAMVTFARMQDRAQGTTQGLRFLTGQAERLPFRDGSIDGVVAVSVTGCLPSLGKLLCESHRILREQGQAIFTFTNQDSPFLRAGDLLQRAMKKIRHEKSEVFRRYREEEVLEALVNVGYQIRSIRYYNYCRTVGIRLLPSVAAAQFCERLSRLPRVNRRLARNFVIVAQKPPE